MNFDFGLLNEFNNMEKVTINGKEYQIDIEKCKEQGLLKEDKWYPKSWEDFNLGYGIPSSHVGYGRCHSGRLSGKDNQEEILAFQSLGKLIQLRDWWWDNMCDGWRPITDDNYIIYRTVDGGVGITIGTGVNWGDLYILSFPTEEIRDKFLEAYRDLIETAKMFL